MNGYNPEIREQIFTMYRNIKYLREKNKLTIKQLSEIMEISERNLIMAENCKELGCFNCKHLKNACLYFNVSADMLFNESLY